MAALLLAAALLAASQEASAFGLGDHSPAALLVASSTTPASAVPPLAYHPARGDRIVVFAAHPDDETLGAGGLIHAAAAAGARVTIVIFTNGDGYLKGVDIGFHTLLSTPGRFIEFGKLRQQEALAASRQLGIPASQVRFLGYPDRGLGILWGSRWDCRTPYRSPYTRRGRSPYRLTFHPASRYCGRDVLEDVETILAAEQPAAVVTHHPGDTHGDHWASEAFVTLAVEHLASQGAPWAVHVQTLHYLIHRGAWPFPATYAPDLALAPPGILRGPRNRWGAFALAPDDEDAKRRAAMEYRTQVRLQRTYISSFIRRNELFDQYAPVYADAARAGGPPPGGHPASRTGIGNFLRTIQTLGRF